MNCEFMSGKMGFDIGVPHASGALVRGQKGGACRKVGLVCEIKMGYPTQVGL